jgi:ketosteroid isomerase-like protein
MSENVEIVRAALEAYNRRDLNGLFTDAAPDLEVDLSRAAGPQKGMYKGHAEIRGVLEDFFETWESFRLEPHDFIEEGDDVIVPWTIHAEGRSGIEVRARPTWTFTVRDGAIERISMYQELEDALEAAGVSK